MKKRLKKIKNNIFQIKEIAKNKIFVKKPYKKAIKIKIGKFNFIKKLLLVFFGWFALLLFVAIFYFLILTSVGYKSFPLITNFVENWTNQNLASADIKIDKSYIKFSHLSSFNIRLEGVKINYQNQNLIFPKIETEFPVYDLFFLKLKPSQLKIIDPEITIENKESLATVALNGVNIQKFFNKDLQQFFESLLPYNKELTIKNFSILNAKIIIKNPEQDKQILIKEAHFNTYFSSNNFNLKSKVIINFDPKITDLLLNFKCQLLEDEGLKCDLDFNNFVPNSIISLNQKLLPLKNINATLQGKIGLSINQEKKISKVDFIIKSLSGSFDYPQFFDKKIDFNNLSLKGQWRDINKKLTIDNLSINFDRAKFEMSLMADNLGNKNLQRTTMHFAINDVKTDNLDSLWPVFLDYGIKKWATKHIEKGLIKKGYADLVFQYKNGIEHLEKIDSKINFYGLNLNYDEYFPKIFNIDGVASFSKQAMKIDIDKADLLQSKINTATIEISDFNAKTLMLNISGKISGNASDALKHIDYKGEFAKKIEAYFNGFAKSKIDIRLPISDSLNLKDLYIEVDSNIENFNNEYIDNNSSLVVSTVKEVGNNDFKTEIDLNKASLNLKLLNIFKEKDVVSKIKATLSFDQKNYLLLKNFEWKQEKQSINGDLLIQINPVKIKEIKLKNYNFANNNFGLSYKVTEDSLLLKIKGKNLDLKNYFQLKSYSEESELQFYKNNNIEIDLDKVELANNQKLKTVSIKLNCQSFLCENGFVKAFLDKGKNINVSILNTELDIKNKNDHLKISGNIDDISAISKGFNLSGQIIGGKLIINSEFNKRNDLIGVLKIDSGFTILKNELVERISKENIFANIKNKILSSNEINFNNLRIEFILKNNIFKIESLIASSELIGFTAKGNVDLTKNEIALKGLIVPGYALNKIFGIGQIPILGNIIVGEKGGGVFAIRYDYDKKNGKSNFATNPASVIVPGVIRNVFDLF